MSAALPRHGGDLAAATARWGEPAAGWIDLSTGINPWAYPLPSLAPDVWTRLPDAGADHALRLAAAHRYGAPGAEWVLPAPGTSALIQALPRLLPPTEVAILGPTYGEHAVAWDQAGHHVHLAEDIEGIGAARAVLVVNPNNPDGRLVPPDRLAALAESLATEGGLLVIDEAFADAVPGASILPRLPPATVVLRSFGKFYGLAGLRLGFAVAAPEMLAGLAAQLGPWPASGPALAIGRQALEDDAWAADASVRLAAAAEAVDGILAQAGLTVVGGTPLFRLARHPDARELWHRLGRAGILVRAFIDRPDLLRVGLPADIDGLRRLALALR